LDVLLLEEEAADDEAPLLGDDELPDEDEPFEPDDPLSPDELEAAGASAFAAFLYDSLR
jgi:hypothetical protein